MKGTGFCILLITAACLVTAGTTESPAEKPTLLVYGDGFVFGVTEPAGWQGDTSKAADFHVNAVFFPSGPDSRKADVTIRIRLNHKVDENTAADLGFDIADYKKRYPGVQFADLSVSHPTYTLFPKLFFVPASFYEYVVYVNPGAAVPFSFSVTMSVQRRPASSSELAAFRRVLASLRLLKPGPAG